MLGNVIDTSQQKTATEREPGVSPKLSERLPTIWGAQSAKNVRRIKWGSATQRVENRPKDTTELEGRLIAIDSDPQSHDVFVAEISSSGRHSRIELDNGRRAAFYVGDIVGVVFGYRYATHQFLGEVPALLERYHMLSQGGVSGRVVSSPESFAEPTQLKALGYLAQADGQKVNLRDFALSPRKDIPSIKTIVVVGSSMDAGKTTTAASTIRGLCAAGYRVNAGKLTGTACAKDLLMMFDAGANQVLDFSSAGFASTSMASRDELARIADTLISHLSADQPDYLVLEIADGIIQRETQMLLSYMKEADLVDDLLLAVHDVLAAPTCLQILKDRWQFEPSVISGAATITPLSTQELQSLVPMRCLEVNHLSSPEIAGIFATPKRLDREQ